MGDIGVEEVPVFLNMVGRAGVSETTAAIHKLVLDFAESSYPGWRVTGINSGGNSSYRPDGTLQRAFVRFDVRLQNMDNDTFSMVLDVWADDSKLVVRDISMGAGG
jgi:hypothetical protein